MTGAARCGARGHFVQVSPLFSALRSLVFGAAVLGAGAALPGACVADALQAANASYADALRRIAPHSNGFFVDASPAGRAALDRLWRASRDWAVAFLETHPGATADQLKAAGNGKNANPDIDAIALDANTFAIAASDGEIGTVFVVGRRGERAQAIWDIVQAPLTPRLAILAAWSPDAARTDCRDGRPGADWSRCGPLVGRLLKLPNDARGGPRFAVEGIYAEEAGSAIGIQLSLWRWTGISAEPLLAGTYSDTIEDAVGVRLTGDRLVARQKGEFRSTFVSEPEPGRATDWTIALEPNAVRDLGKTEVAPELAAVDDLLWAVLWGKTDGAAASRPVIAALGQLIRHPPDGGAIDRSQKELALGELMGSAVTRAGAVTRVCFLTEALGPLWFSLISRSGGFFVTGVARAPETSDANCPLGGGALRAHRQPDRGTLPSN